MDRRHCLYKFFVIVLMITCIALPIDTFAEPVISELPLTKSTEKDYDSSFLSVTGFAEGKVSDRTEYLNTDKHRVVSDEYEFVKALDDAKTGAVKIIEITEDLDLGYDSLSEEAKACASIKEYGQSNSAGIISPAINISGVSQLIISDIEGLTIFSQAGVTVRRAEWKLQNSVKDIVIRNIRFDGMWQWSDTNDTKSAGWSLMKVNGAKGVWIDHCSFTIATDGNCDGENGAEGVTYSWCVFGMPTIENPAKDDALYQDVTYQEYLYQTGQIDTDGRYYKLRKAGITKEQILAYDAYHSKACLYGSGDQNFKDNEEQGKEDGNQRLEVTYAYDKAYNIGQRFPWVRQGRAHLVNCYVNSMEHAKMHNNISAFNKYGGWDRNRSINVSNGGTVGADTCVFYGVSEAITGNESYKTDTGLFLNAYNRALVVNSKVTLPNGDEYTGSSWDNGGKTLFGPKYVWYDKSTLGKETWSWYSSIVGVEDMKLTDYESMLAEKKYFKFEYDKETYLPYEYQKMPLEDVESVVDSLSGAYKYNCSPEFWVRTDYDATEDIKEVSKDTVVEVNEVEMNLESYMLPIDETLQIMAEVKPSNATDKTVTYTSSDESVATVYDSGLVVPKQAGDVTITATTANGKSAENKLTIYKAVEKISLEKRTKTIEVGEEYTMTFSVEPEDATDKSVIWSSSNDEIATVDENGNIKGISEGKATIYCTSAKDSLVKASCVITVKAATKTPEPTEDMIALGDVNADGIIDATDALLVLKHAAKIDILDADACKRADVTGDGTIDASDALEILKYAAHIIENYKD